MSDVTVACGEACAGCKDECAACATMACGGCSGCDSEKLARRARVAAASIQLLQIGMGVPAEFGFNPLQKRGPDGRWIKMGGAGSAGGKRIKTSRASAPDAPSKPARDAHGIEEGTRAADLRDAQTERIRASKRAPAQAAPVIPRPRASEENGIAARVKATRNDNGTATYEIAGKQRNWTTAEQVALADALDAVASGQSVPAPIPGRVVSDGYNRRTVGEVQPFRNRDGGVTLTVGRDKPSGDPGDLDMTADEARELAGLLRRTADAGASADRPAQSQAPAGPSSLRFTPEQGAALFDVLDDSGEPPGTVLYDDADVTLTKANEDGDLTVTSKQTGKSKTIRNFRVDGGTVNSAIIDTTTPDAPPTPAATEPDRGPQPVGFTPRTDAEWNLLQKRLGKRTARTEVDGDLQPGDVVPTKDGKWQEVLRRDPAKFWERNGQEGWTVRDDAKGYVHGESAANIKKQIERYAAEKAWRDSGGSKDRLDGVAQAPVQPSGRRPGEPPLGEDGKYAKPVKQYAVHNGEVYERTSRNPYRYAAVVATRDNPQGAVWSWHRTRESAMRGTLTADQKRGGIHVKDVVETGFEDPTGSIMLEVSRLRARKEAEAAAERARQAKIEERVRAVLEGIPGVFNPPTR